jgi:hypothetical protein
MAITSQFEYSDLMSYIRHDRRCRYYKEAVDQAVSFSYHSDGAYPKELIECRRPNEPEDVKEYRCKIWKPKTKPTFTRLLSSLGKIRRSSDWSIKFPPASDFPKIAESETLEEYTTKNYPYFTDFTNWVFDVLLKSYLTDPNGVVMVAPINPNAGVTEYIKPYADIFKSCHVIEYIEGISAILERPEGCWYRTRNKDEKGRSFYIINDQVIEQWDQLDGRQNYGIVMMYPHNLGFLPCFKMGGSIMESDNMHFLYESRISGILPDLDEALREYSDLQASKVGHIFLERWEYTQNECTDCKGTGKRLYGETHIECHKCHGRGYVAAGPYAKMLIRPTNTMEGQAPIPTPPAGYVQKDIDIVELMEKSVRQHIYDALASINFQFLEQTPLNQSGTAKEVDKEELNNTVYTIAEDLVRIMDSCYKRFSWYRYSTLYPSPDDLDAMVPAVAVPEQYDLLSAQYMQTELADAKKSDINPVITSAMELEFAQKRFDSEPEVRDRLALVLRLDPLPNVTEDEKMSRLSNKGITQLTYIISSNIQEFVQRAIEEDPGFPEQDLKDQKAKMMQYAQAQVDAQQATLIPAPPVDITTAA